MFEKVLSLSFAIGNPGRDREQLFAAIEAGSLVPSRILTHTIAIDKAAEAYRAFDTKEMTKVVLTTE